MSSNPFFSKEVKFKRVLKGLAISIPCLIMMFSIGAYLIKEGLNGTHTGDSNQKVLGVESEPKLIGAYGDINDKDTFVWDWSWDRDDYYKLSKFVDSPQYYINDRYFELKQTWDLKNGYKLSLSCTKLDMTSAIPGDVYPCTLSYNNKVLTKNLRYEAYCSDTQNMKDCHANTSFTVYSSVYGDTDGNEYVVLSEWASGSKDWIYVYRLNNGNIELLPFYSNGKEESRYYISSSSYEMYGLYTDWDNMMSFNDKIQLITYFHEPSMGSQSGDDANNVEGIYDVWEINNNKLELKQRIVDLYQEGDTAHWL